MVLFEQLTQVNLFRAWANRPFTYLWSGQTLSRIGDYLYEVALAWWVLQGSGSAGAMATVLIFAMAPKVLFSLFGGVIVDRYPRLPLMIGSDMVRGGTAVLISLLAFNGSLQIWHVFVLSAVFGLVDAFFHPAFMATVPAIVSEDDLSSANSLTSFAVQAGRIAGPPLGVGLIALGGTGLAFAFNGLTFFVSALFLLPLLRLDTGSPCAAEPQSLLTDFKEGLRTVRQTPWLWLTISLFALSNLALTGPYSVSMPFLVNDVLQADVNVLGLLYAMFAVGYVLGGIWLGRYPVIRHRGRLVYGGLVVAGGMLLLFGLPVGIPLLMLAALINGAALEVGMLAWTNALQERVPRQQLGRIISVDTLGSFAFIPVGLALTGWAVEWVGPAQTFIIGGGLTALAALLAFCHPSVRQLD